MCLRSHSPRAGRRAYQWIEISRPFVHTEFVRREGQKHKNCLPYVFGEQRFRGGRNAAVCQGRVQS